MDLACLGIWVFFPLQNTGEKNQFVTCNVCNPLVGNSSTVP